MVIETQEKTLHVLEIGGYPNPQAYLMPFWGGAHITHMNIDPESGADIIGDAAEMPPECANTFDGIFASHVLEHFSYWITEKVIAGWVNCLVEGGSLHVVVPSWEWSARQVLSENPSPAIFGHTFAGHVNSWDVHLCMFTMRRLRYLFDHAGLSVTNARTGTYKIHFQGTIYDAEQHYICGVKGSPPLLKE